jgi:hypothetical protein
MSVTNISINSAQHHRLRNEEDNIPDHNLITINDQIAKILDDNKLNDLHRFLNKRQCLNCCNFYMAYLFYLIQSGGILLTMIATSYNNQPLIWAGVGLNIFASLIHVYEKNNNSISEKLMKDIKLIRENKYIDEGTFVDLDNTNKQKQHNTNTNSDTGSHSNTK